MPRKLELIKSPIEAEMKEFEHRFRDAMKSKVPLLDRIMHYITHRKGKQIRPMFVFLSAKLLGKVNDSTYTAASMVELLHTATLVHDDVVDGAEKRRGFFSINAIWKNKIAVLVGDYLLSKGLLVALDNREHQLLHILSDAVRKMSEGELQQISKARRLDIQESVYYEIIEKKTASFLAAACAVGAASVQSDQAVIDKIWQFGQDIGMAFQIKDDLFDYGQWRIGKPVGIDIKEKKLTLPLIYALQQASASERRSVINMVKNENHKASKVQEVIAFAKEKGGIEYATSKMESYRDRALEALQTFPENEARRSLKDLVYFVTERKK
ncbi:MAG: polyprenyl synthetase family protein [Saprospiraceae bacterium]|nr:polyprenyl synthetase family protein [Saprospiraceae bacterium]